MTMISRPQVKGLLAAAGLSLLASGACSSGESAANGVSGESAAGCEPHDCPMGTDTGSDCGNETSCPDSTTAGDGPGSAGEGSSGEDETTSGGPPPGCGDGLLGGDETDVDCGGPDCPTCEEGRGCLEDSDCASETCVGMVCGPAGEPLPAADFYVDQAIGDDGNTGTSKADAFATIQRGIDAATAGDIVEVADGVYYEVISVANKGTGPDAQLWLRAENRGGAVLSGALAPVRAGEQDWASEGGGTWSIAHSNDVWGGYDLEGETFLPRFKTRNDLQSTTIDLQDAGLTVRTPTYGVAQDNGRLYLRLADGGDPNGREIIVPRDWHVEVLDVSDTPYFHLDGFWVEAGGDQSGTEAAITFDSGSENGSIMNCISTLQRVMARLPSNFEVRWSEHFYPGFKELAEDFRAANGNPGTVNHLWDYIKNYNRNPGTGTGGNAYYGGTMYRASSGSAPVNVRGEHLYVHEVFDGINIGEFEDSSVSNSVFDYTYDDCIELENNQTDSNGSGLEIYENLFLNASVIWLSRRSPDAGPIFVYRNVLKPYDGPHGRGPHMLKTGGTADVYLYFNTLVKLNGMDHGTAHLGWGSTDAVTWNNDVTDIHLRNNAVIFEDGLQGSQPGLSGDTDYNLFYSGSDLTQIRGGNGVFVNRNAGTDAIGFADYGSDWTPEGPSLVANAGPIPDGWNAPNNDWGTDDLGCFQASDPQPSDWPRRYDRSEAYSISNKHFETPRRPPSGWP